MTKSNGKTGGRPSPSLFGPIILIAIGAYFLLRNLGALPDLAWNWAAVLQLWPLWLIFLGVNIIVKQAPQPFGAFFSALVGITAVALAGYVLLFAEDNPLLARLGVNTEEVAWQTETVSFPLEDAETAVVELDFSSPAASLYALEDSNDLINGTIAYTGDLIFETEREGDEAHVRLDTRTGQDWTWIFNPGTWDEADREWAIGLSPRTPLDLQADLSSGSVEMDLSELSLSALSVDGSSGSFRLALPDGDYPVQYDASSGSTRINLPEAGQIDLDIEGSSGSLILYLPESMEARLDVSDGSGSLSLDDRFTQVSGDDPDEGVWETAAYDDAPNRITLTLDVGSGSVRVRQP
jgi:hypothetical protein